MSQKTKKTALAGKRPWKITVENDQTNAEAAAAKLIGPVNRHGALAPLFGGALGNGLPEADRPDIVEYAQELRVKFETARKGNLNEASDLLVAQSVTLDGIFTEAARRAANNMSGGYLQAFEIYMRVALKAQAQSRATIEALAKLHQPREQTVRHVHVNEGGQAIVADNFHAGGTENGKSNKQSHATSATGERAALPSPDETGNGMPIASSKRQAPLQNARRHESGRA